MSTNSITLIHSDGFDSKFVVAMYRYMDGDFDGHGEELAVFLKDFAIVNGIIVPDGEKIANGMDCLAAQVVAHFKKGTGGIYLQPTDVYAEVDYIYSIYLKDGKLCLVGEDAYTGETRYLLDVDDNVNNNEKETVTFLYEKDPSQLSKRRMIKVTGDSDAYIEGMDLDIDEFRRFSKNKIRGEIKKVS